MSEFTYEIPDTKKFFIVIRQIVENRGTSEAKKIIKACHSCSIESSGQFSRRRWDEFIGSIQFNCDFSYIKEITPVVENEILSICDSIMPNNSGIGLMSISFIPDFNSIDTTENIMEDISEISFENENSIISEILDDEIIKKGKELSQVYNYLFIIENSLRKFIIKVFTDSFGIEYFSKVNINNSIKNGIAQRKTQEQKNSWLSIRGDSDIYYLDFIDLNFLIKNNWELFKDYFPSQNWIEVKIDELYKCRCLIAHNSNISDHEINVIRVNYKSIILQLIGKK